MTAAPKRTQRKRTKGWSMPPNTVVVTRPTKYGNPFTVTTKMKPGTSVASGMYVAVPTVEDAIECYRMWLTENPRGREVASDAKAELRGKNLSCWCKPGALCHADVLLEIANK